MFNPWARSHGGEDRLTSYAGGVLLELFPFRCALLRSRLRRFRDAEPLSRQVHAVVDGVQLVPETPVGERDAVFSIRHVAVLRHTSYAVILAHGIRASVIGG